MAEKTYDVTELFGLQAPAGTDSETTQQKDSADQHPESDNDGALVMTEYEYGQLKAAYDTTMSRTGEEAEFAQDEYIRYGSSEPLTVTITHILHFYTIRFEKCIHYAKISFSILVGCSSPCWFSGMAKG